jgi:hypothetical protein
LKFTVMSQLVALAKPAQNRDDLSACSRGLLTAFLLALLDNLVQKSKILWPWVSLYARQAEYVVAQYPYYVVL